ncbi:hypothetical protein [Spiroplasma sp. AdecLV25b]|uniref:hypothetical protein n=1 Tax=Spiroplasma sp. AdecLV25b TaxID=3027162 RepID=UPI0027E0C463|nr:hypothetical protein [Spiroplasma sp. AdecLV25b]
MKNKSWDWRKLQRGRGIRVQIINDIEKETGKQKYRPAIVIKSYPSHVKVQLITTESSNHDYFNIKNDNHINFIRPIYSRTIKFNEISDIWKDTFNKSIELDRYSTFFIKLVQMEIKENFNINPNSINYSVLKKHKEQLEQLIDWIHDLQEENSKFKTQLDTLKK